MTYADSTVSPEAGLTTADHMLGDAPSSVTLIESGDCCLSKAEPVSIPRQLTPSWRRPDKSGH